MGYHTHDVVDGGKSRIILAVLVTPTARDGKPTDARVRVFRARFRWKLWLRQITGDTAYGTIETIVAVEDQHMRAYVPLPDFDKRTPVYGKQAFRYDPERDVYICPKDATLPLHTHAYNEREKRYQAAAATCNVCPLKPQCTTSDQGRVLKRSFDEEYLEQVRTYHVTEPYQKAMRRFRSCWRNPVHFSDEFSKSFFQQAVCFCVTILQKLFELVYKGERVHLQGVCPQKNLRI